MTTIFQNWLDENSYPEIKVVESDEFSYNVVTDTIKVTTELSYQYLTVLEYAKDYLGDNEKYEHWNFKRDGASLICQLLFEEATEKEGFFFRQYPLVDNGTLVENPPKGKAIRKALCDRNGEIMVIMSQTPESFHDFAQALVDMKVDNAIYLVGSTSFGYFRDYYDHLAIIYNKFRYGYQYENFIVWRMQ